MFGGRSRFGAGASLLALVVLLGGSAPAAAGLFDFLFGRRQEAPAPAPPPAPERPRAQTPQPSWRSSPRVSGGLGTSASYCVRLCDGRYFPIQRSSLAQATQVCSALCPASPTKVFSGSDVARASASDGSRYEDLPNAFVYRDKTIDSCTCNGRSPFGLASLDANDDPTLRQGDLIATADGLVRASGARQVYGKADDDDVTSSLGLRGQVDSSPEPDPPPRRARRSGRSDFFSRQNAWR